jgi:hypothetical protein
MARGGERFEIANCCAKRLDQLGRLPMAPGVRRAPRRERLSCDLSTASVFAFEPLDDGLERQCELRSAGFDALEKERRAGGRQEQAQLQAGSGVRGTHLESDRVLSHRPTS